MARRYADGNFDVDDANGVSDALDLLPEDGPGTHSIRLRNRPLQRRISDTHIFLGNCATI